MAGAFPLEPVAMVQTYTDAIKGGKASQVAVSSFKAFEALYGDEFRDHVRSSYRGGDTFVDAAPSKHGTPHADGVGYTEDYSADTLATPRDIP